MIECYDCRECGGMMLPRDCPKCPDCGERVCCKERCQRDHAAHCEPAKKPEGERRAR